MKQFELARASVTVGGKRYILKPGKEMLGAIETDFVCKQPEENFRDWTVRITNTGDENTERITDFNGWELFLPLSEDEPFVYNGLRGDDCSADSFAPESVSLAAGETLTREPAGGRPSDTTAFPYFDFSVPGYSAVCGIGWSGQWLLRISRDEQGVTVSARQRDCDTVLYPGEAIRSVRILLWAGEADTLRARQQFVACHRRYASPFARYGADYDCPIATQCFDRYFWSAKTEEGKAPYFETEEAQRRICENAGKCEFINMHWVDACWFKGTFRSGVGNYSEYSVGFPNGLRGVSEAAHENGQKFIVWFEPVRAVRGTETWDRFYGNPKQLIPSSGGSTGLLNLGDDEVWEWVYSHIVSVMETNGIDCYREDFNITPLDFLPSIEEEGRMGMVQMRFTEGIYKLWDALSARFPGLFIDNCASGGRLLDAETCSRAFSLWQSDTACFPAVNDCPTAMIEQNQNLTLSRYIPHHQGSAFTTDAYTVRSAATYGIACEFAFLDEHFDVNAAKAAVCEARRMSRYWKGDFTPLTEFSKSADGFCAYALSLSEKEGMLAVFRRPEETADTFTAHLPGIQRDGLYRITKIDEQREENTETVPGSALENLPVRIDAAPASMLVLWEKIEG